MYGLCSTCRYIAPHRRPLHAKYRPPLPYQYKQKETEPLQLANYEVMVCGCDYMQFPLNAKTHTGYECPNAKVVKRQRTD